MVILAYVLVTMKSGAEKDVLKKVSSFEEALEVDLLYCEYDAILKVRVEEMSQLDKFSIDKLEHYLTSF